MFCIYCGTQNDDNNAFCIKCGKMLKGTENSVSEVKAETANQHGTESYQGSKQAPVQPVQQPNGGPAEYYPIKAQMENKSMGVRFTAVLLAAITIISMLISWVKIGLNDEFESDLEAMGLTELSAFEMTGIASEVYDMAEKEMGRSE